MLTMTRTASPTAAASANPAPALPRHLSDWPEPGRFEHGSVVTMGVFDGFHRGHQALVRRARTRAHRLRVPSVLLTFDPHPLVLTCPERAPRPLLSVAERVQAALDLGIDHVLVLPFNRRTAAITAEDFVRDGLVDRLAVRHVVVGANFRFGRRATGDTDYLHEAGEYHGFDVDAVPLVEHHGRVCSSTTVRGLLAHGDIATARELLGRSADRVLPRGPVAAPA